MNKDYFVYIATNPSRTVLYTGITSNLRDRIWKHENKLYPGFTALYNVFILIYFERFIDVHNAIAREKQLKGWSRKKKEWLIGRSNPGWYDLFGDE